MRGAVGTHKARAVNTEHNRQFLNGHIVNHLVVGTLQERGVERGKWFFPSAAKPAANVTACCSAMPTSKARSGNVFIIGHRLEPLGIAGVIDTIFTFFAASSTSASPNTSWYFWWFISGR